MIKCIIPCCGFGTRMNMPPNQSKELLLDSNNKYLIEYPMEICKKFNLEPIFIVRPEKQDLIKYLQNNNYEPFITSPGKEWAQTVLKSQELWDEKQNILLLPDTRFEPISVINDIKKSLEFGSEAIFAVHEVDNISKWGFVSKAVYAEKPNLVQPGPAWGIIGFTKKAGTAIFTNMQQKFYNAHEFCTNFVFLDNFKDVTRTGKIE